MKRSLVYFIVITTLILLFSCGIPNVYVPESSDITITRDSTSGTFTVTLSDTIRNELRDSSPTLYFLYTISSSDQDRKYVSLFSSFNSEIASDTNGEKIKIINPAYFITNTEDNKTYSIYQLTQSRNIFYFQMGKDESSLTLTLERDTAENTLSLSDSSGNTVYSGIQRAVGDGGESYFTKNNVAGDIVDYSESEIYTVNVYLVVSCDFSSYSNTYNTKIYYDSPVLSFNL